MTALPRTTCPECLGDVALRKGGLIREHKDQRHALYATGRNDEVPTCAASGGPGLCPECGEELYMGHDPECSGGGSQ